ncbi:hypothetical protein PRIC1_009878 [Phytophthora ramorum]
MRFHRGLLATVFILVAATNALASKSTTEPDLGDNHKRLLRVSKTPDEEEREESATSGCLSFALTPIWLQMFGHWFCYSL